METKHEGVPSSSSSAPPSVGPAGGGDQDLRQYIMNSAIADVLRSSNIPVIDVKLGAINAAINSTPLEVNGQASEKNYKLLIDKIDGILDMSGDQAFYEAFSIKPNASGTMALEAKDGNSASLILNQYEYNSALTKALEDPSYSTDSGFIQELLCLEKDFVLTEEMLNNALDALQSCDNREDFLRELEDTNCAKLLEQNISEEAFYRLKIQNLTALDDSTGQLVPYKLEKIKSDIESYSEENEAWDEVLKDSAPILDIKPIHFMSSAFQAEFKANRKAFLEKEAHFKSLAEKCKVGMHELSRQRFLLDGYASSIDSLDDDIEEKEKLLNELRAEQESLNNKIDELTALRAKLEDPKQGVLLFIEKVKASNKELVLNLENFGFSKPEKEKGAPELSAMPVAVEISENSNAANYLEEDELKPGTFRSYPYKENNGSFKEYASTTGRQLYVEKKDDIPTDSGERKEFFLGMAAQILASRKSAPTELKPIKLMGNDADAMLGLYAALRHLARLETRMKFDPDTAISWSNKNFNPNASTCDGMYGTDYDKEFKEAMDEKDLTPAITAADKANSSITAEYKGKLQEINRKNLLTDTTPLSLPEVKSP